MGAVGGRRAAHHGGDAEGAEEVSAVGGAEVAAGEGAVGGAAVAEEGPAQVAGRAEHDEPAREDLVEVGVERVVVVAVGVLVDEAPAVGDLQRREAVGEDTCFGSRGDATAWVLVRRVCFPVGLLLNAACVCVCVCVCVCGVLPVCCC